MHTWGMYDTLETLRENIRARQAQLGLPLMRISRAAGHDARWIHKILQSGRYKKGIGSSVLDQVAEALGIPPWELVRPGLDPASWPPPEHLREEIARRRRPRAS